MNKDSIKNTYLSPQNLDFTFNQVRNNVIKKANYDIVNKPVFRDSYNKMAIIIFNKTPETDMNLVSLNNRLQDKCASYFHSIIEKKRQGSEKGDRPDQLMPIIDKQSTQYSINGSINGNSMIDCVEEPDSVSNTTLYQKQKNIINDNVSNNKEGRNQLNGESIAMQSSGSPIDPLTDNRVIPQEDNMNMNINDIIFENVQNGTPMYNNMEQLEEAENMSPMDRMKMYEAERSMPIEQILQDETSQKILNDYNSYSLGRDSMLLDAKHRNATAEPLELLRQEHKVKKQILEETTKGNIGNNNNNTDGYHVNNIEKDRLLEAILKHQQRNEPQYIEKVHFVSVNSLDRDLSISKNNRYQFKVNIGVTDGQGTLGVNSSFKNIVSVEILDVMIPYDTNLLPYDNRILLTPLSYPYLLLHIDELKGVYTGTNTNTERVFSHLTLDKDHSSVALSSDYVSSNVNITDYAGGAKTINTFDNQFQRGYLRFHPSFFDKKSFLNAPLASLNRMTVKITDPFGNLINNNADVVDISAVAFEAAADKAIDSTVGFPRTDIANYKICKITTSTKFSNRLFRIGDRIKIEDLVSDNKAFQNFINRDEGHIIINLDSETNKNDETGDNGNRGYINNIYISPPGELDSTNGTLNTASYSEATGTVSAYGRLVNTNLQTHLIFKITTRETDVKSIIQPLNI